MAITDKRYLSGDEYLRDTWRLAAQVRESGWQPDILIALWRGGAPVGVAMHEDYKVAGWNVSHIAVKCETLSLACCGRATRCLSWTMSLTLARPPRR